MTAFIHHIETLVPEHAYDQQTIAQQMAQWMPDSARQIRQLYRRTAINTRYSVLPDFNPHTEPLLYTSAPDGAVTEPSTHQRNRQFIRSSRKMVTRLAESAISNAEGFQSSDITHVITVSCTGFYCPGPDCDVVDALGLPGTTERYNLGFMGCYAAMPALRMAAQFCDARPDAVVLVICLELCTLHMQLSDCPDSILANALFADGAAAAVVSARPPVPGRPAFQLGAFVSALAREGENDMSWEIGDSGFNMVLSSYIPEIISMNLGRVLENVGQRSGIDIGLVDLWAVHPGGKAILDKVQQGMELENHQLADSRDILRRYGNMSSATVLFVLKQMLERPEAASQLVCAMAFGPGLTIESALMQLVPAGEAESIRAAHAVAVNS